MSFTPGPWAVVPTPFQEGFTVNAQPHAALRGFTKVVAFIGDESNAEVAANARLIAAAPDLIDFVKWVDARGGDNNQMEIFQRARTLLSKAQGQPSVSGGEDSQ